jgi:predicted metal-dependent RNase
MSLLMLDLVKIMRSEGKEPLYTSEEIKEMVKHTITLEYEEVTDVTPDVRLTFYNAGHVLGSAMVHLHVGNGLHNLLYTGDMKYGKSVMLSPAATQFPRLETLMIEATYGGKDNILPGKQEAYDYLKEVITATLAKKGKVLIPVLGLGRAQDIMIMIEELVRTEKIEKVKVFVDGMVWDITAIHTAYPEYLNSAIRKQIFHKDNNPFLSDIFKEIASQKERQQVLEEEGSCIILATSGMLQGGPSVEYLKNLASNPNNSLIFSSYQGEGSLGRRIQNGEREIIFRAGQKQEMVQIKMDVHKLEISDHSDRRELMNFVTHLSPRPKKVILNHGENSRCLDLASSIHKLFRIETLAPRNLEAIRLK